MTRPDVLTLVRPGLRLGAGAVLRDRDVPSHPLDGQALALRRCAIMSDPEGIVFASPFDR